MPVLEHLNIVLTGETTQRIADDSELVVAPTESPANRARHRVDVRDLVQPLKRDEVVAVPVEREGAGMVDVGNRRNARRPILWVEVLERSPAKHRLTGRGLALDRVNGEQRIAGAAERAQVERLELVTQHVDLAES